MRPLATSSRSTTSFQATCHLPWASSSQPLVGSERVQNVDDYCFVIAAIMVYFVSVATSCCEPCQDVPNGLAALSKLPVLGGAQIIAFAGLIETTGTLWVAALMQNELVVI